MLSRHLLPLHTLLVKKLIPMAYTTNGIAVVVVLCYTITLLTYRLVFSPLAKFPGPKIAAASGWYEFYHDCWRNGKYIFEIERLHKIYGPIVRINPWELSIHDPEFYKELYVSGSVRRTELYSHFAEGVDLEGRQDTTPPHSRCLSCLTLNRVSRFDNLTRRSSCTP